MGILATPVTVINGEPVVGLDERRFQELLSQAGLAGARGS